jgi:hypothetical protein
VPKLIYTAYTPTQQGDPFEFTGDVEEAREKALRYAVRYFGKPKFKGAGPRIVVIDVKTGKKLVDEAI